MKRALSIFLCLALALSLFACGGKTETSAEEGKATAAATSKIVHAEEVETERSKDVMRMKIGDTEVAVTWEENESVEALKDLVASGELSIQMSMYGGFEQVGPLGASLPRSDVPTTTEAGDIVLYSGNQLVVFYGSNSWSYTKLGHITDKTKEELTELLSAGDTVITLSLDEPAQTEEMLVCITAGDHVITAKLYDNAAGRALWDMLPLTLPMMNLYGREMCYRFGAGTLPTEDAMDAGYEIGDISYWPPAGSLVILYKQNGEVFEQQPIGHTDDDISFFEGMADTDITFEKAETPKTAPAEPVVYFTSDISAEGLVRLYQQLGWQPTGKVAVKISTGEPPASNYLRPELIGDLVRLVDGTIVECNTAYGGSRSSAAMHKQVAEDHGFTAIADFDLLDEEGEVEWPVTGGDRLSYIIIGSHSENYTDWVILSHYKGHQMAGFGGAIKNVGIGASSARGKVLVHTAGTKTSGSIFYSDQDAWLEALAEMVDGFVDHVGTEHIIYINVMNRLSVDCDCNGHPAEPDIHDIGILASADPVALDQACYDLVAQAEGNAALMNRIERQHGLHTLEHAEEIGLGSRTYILINIDE